MGSYETKMHLYVLESVLRLHIKLYCVLKMKVVLNNF